MTRCRRALLLSARITARHWGIAVLLLCGAALRAATMVSFWPALVYIDTPRYLGNFALGIDPLGYEFLFVRPVLLLHTGLAGVAAAQHLLGLAIGVALYALAFRHGAPRWLAALAAAPVLLDAYQLQAEQMIMSDVFFETLICAALVILAWPASRHRVVTRVAVAALLLGLATTVRQVGEMALIPLLVYAVLSRRKPDSRPAKGARARLALMAVAVFAVPVLGYMTLSATVLGSGFGLANTSNKILYARLGDAVDCTTLRLPASERGLCPEGSGLGIDALANSPDSPIHTYQPPPGVTSGTEVSRFDRAVLTQQPLRVAGDITSDAIKVFALTKDGAPGDPPLNYWQFQTTYPVFQPAYRMVFGSDPSKPRADPVLAPALRWYQMHGGFTPGPLLLVFALLSVFGVFAPRAPRPLRAGAAIGAGLVLAIVGGADLFEFSWRYQLPALVTLPPAGVLGAMAAAGTIRRCTRIRLTLNPRSGRWPAAFSTPTRGSASAGTTSSDPTAPEAPTRSSSGTTSP